MMRFMTRSIAVPLYFSICYVVGDNLIIFSKYIKKKLDNSFYNYNLYDLYIGCQNEPEHTRRRTHEKDDYIFNIENEKNIEGENLSNLEHEYLEKFGEKYNHMSSCKRYAFFKNYGKKK